MIVAISFGCTIALQEATVCESSVSRGTPSTRLFTLEGVESMSLWLCEWYLGHHVKIYNLQILWRYPHFEISANVNTPPPDTIWHNHARTHTHTHLSCLWFSACVVFTTCQTAVGFSHVIPRTFAEDTGSWAGEFFDTWPRNSCVGKAGISVSFHKLLST